MINFHVFEWGQNGQNIVFTHQEKNAGYEIFSISSWKLLDLIIRAFEKSFLGFFSL